LLPPTQSAPFLGAYVGTFEKILVLHRWHLLFYGDTLDKYRFNSRFLLKFCWWSSFQLSEEYAKKCPRE